MNGRRADLWVGLAGGGLAVLAGLAVAWIGAGYEVGTARRMGPGWFPVALGLLMAALGLGLALASLRPAAKATPAADSAATDERPDLRALLAVGAGLAAFALLLERAGLIPAAFALVLLAGLGGARMSLARQLLLAGGLALGSLLIFRMGLGLPLKPLAGF